ncbi:MAG: sorbosone dehydrogenase family protein [Bacteroidetes bacterium]|nr:MAG: sorbosone dehydrogenase family protein [Bacteroidota bacterium]
MKNRNLIIFGTVILIVIAFSFSLFEKPAKKESLQLDKIVLPEGFKIEVYAHVPNARSMVLSENGTLFVGNRSEDKVYAVQDTDGDNIGEKVYVIDEGLKMPNGVALKDGDLYVAEVSRILKYEDIEANLENPPKAKVVFDGYPTETHHGWKYIAFGPDGLLYVPVGAPCNICFREDNPIYTSITRLDVENPKPEIVATGIRNTVGFDWDPETGKLWFTDNGRDMMGDDIPPCELNVVSDADQHFGYPYCHGGELLDPEFGKGKDCADYTSPVWKFGAHTAPLGMNFYEGKMFPAKYDNMIFAALHGSWNRSKKVGYNIMAITHDETGASNTETFAYGWLNEDTQKAWGRPVDVINMPDGSILVSDDYADVVYRISYVK